MANTRPKKYTAMKNLYFMPIELRFAEEMTWRKRYNSVSEYIRELIHEDMKKNPDVFEKAKDA